MSAVREFSTTATHEAMTDMQQRTMAKRFSMPPAAGSSLGSQNNTADLPVVGKAAAAEPNVKLKSRTAIRNIYVSGKRDADLIRLIRVYQGKHVSLAFIENVMADFMLHEQSEGNSQFNPKMLAKYMLAVLHKSGASPITFLIALIYMHRFKQFPGAKITLAKAFIGAFVAAAKFYEVYVGLRLPAAPQLGEHGDWEAVSGVFLAEDVEKLESWIVSVLAAEGLFVSSQDILSVLCPTAFAICHVPSVALEEAFDLAGFISKAAVAEEATVPCL